MMSVIKSIKNSLFCIVWRVVLLTVLRINQSFTVLDRIDVFSACSYFWMHLWHSLHLVCGRKITLLYLMNGRDALQLYCSTSVSLLVWMTGILISERKKKKPKFRAPTNCQVKNFTKIQQLWNFQRRGEVWTFLLWGCSTIWSDLDSAFLDFMDLRLISSNNKLDNTLKTHATKTISWQAMYSIDLQPKMRSSYEVAATIK